MDVGTCSDQHQINSDTQHRKRKRKHKGGNDGLSARKQKTTGINELADDVLIAILSRLSRKEAARTSVLSRRWRYLRFFSSGTLEFDHTDMFSSHDKDMFTSKIYCTDIDTRVEFLRKKFIAYVDRVLKLHQDASVDGLVIRFGHLRGRSPSGRRPGYIDKWIYFALRKEVKTLELNFSPHYDFPDVDMLLSHSNDVHKFGFGSLRSLRLVGVDIKDETVHYFLASCPYLEQLSITASYAMNNLRVVDPLPSLKVLEISFCTSIRSLEVSATNLVSCTYQGFEVNLKIPNLTELTLGGYFAQSLIYEPNKHSGYSVQLVKLALNIPWDKYLSRRDWRRPPDFPQLPQLYSLKHLELDVWSLVGRSIHFFSSLIKASPLLNEFKIKISYFAGILPDVTYMRAGFPEVFPKLVPYQCCHKNLATVKMSGYVGCLTDDEFVLQLLKIAPFLETVTIDTESDYYGKRSWNCCRKKCSTSICRATGLSTGARTRIEAKERAEKLKLCLSQEIKAVLTVM